MQKLNTKYYPVNRSIWGWIRMAPSTLFCWLWGHSEMPDDRIIIEVEGYPEITAEGCLCCGRLWSVPNG